METRVCVDSNKNVVLPSQCPGGTRNAQRVSYFLIEILSKFSLDLSITDLTSKAQNSRCWVVPLCAYK